MLRTILFILMLLAASCKKEETIQVETRNNPPVAIAGNDLTVHIPETSTTLDGSKSYDKESGITSYTWRQLSGHDARIYPMRIDLVIIERLREGDYEFELKVTDQVGQVDTDTVKVTVVDEFAVGKKPVITFNCDLKFVASLNTNTYLLAKAYVENDMGIRYGIPAGFNISQLYGPSQAILRTDSNNDPGNVEISATNLLRGNYAFKIEVERKGLTSSDTAIVQVVNDSLSGKEYVFDTIWTKDASGYFVANSPERPDLFYSDQNRSMEVWLKTEEENWYQASDDIWGYADIYYFWIDECGKRLQVYSSVVNANHLLNKKVKIRIRYT